MTDPVSWWHTLSWPAKFRLYSRITLQSSVVVVVAVMVITTGSWWHRAGMLVAGVAAIAVLQQRPEFALSPSGSSRRWLLSTAAVVLAGTWLAYAVVAGLATEESAVERARAAGLCVALVAMFTIVPFLRYRWWVVLVISLATGLAYGSSPRTAILSAAAALLAGGFVVGTTLLTVWTLRVVEDLDRAKVVEAELQVAEERLRFARDLHDIVGRGFSAIAVKSELAAVLSRSGAVDRAAIEMDEVKTLAVESMGQMRELVRGYRGIDLTGEVAGARSLLSAIGCLLVVEGDPDTVPARFHEVAAWAVREGTTNIVRHSSATVATLAFGDAGLFLRNDRPHGSPGERSGLNGLAERLEPLGATLGTCSSRDEFVLEIHWEKI